MNQIKELQQTVKKLNSKMAQMQQDISVMRSELRERATETTLANYHPHNKISSKEQFMNMEAALVSNSPENVELRKSLVRTDNI